MSWLLDTLSPMRHSLLGFMPCHAPFGRSLLLLLLPRDRNYLLSRQRQQAYMQTRTAFIAFPDSLQTVCAVGRPEAPSTTQPCC